MLNLRFVSSMVKENDRLLQAANKLFRSNPTTNELPIWDACFDDRYIFAMTNENNLLLAAGSGLIDEVNRGMFRLTNVIVQQNYRGMGLGSLFLNCIEREVKLILSSTRDEKYCLKIRVIAGGNSAHFYLRNGFTGEDFILFKEL